MTEYAGSTELTAARVRHLAHRGQLPETARMLAGMAFADCSYYAGWNPCMARAKRLQCEYWERRASPSVRDLFDGAVRRTASSAYEEVEQHLERNGTIRRDPRWTA